MALHQNREYAWALLNLLEKTMTIEEEWNDAVSPEPKSQEEIKTRIQRLELQITNSETDPAVAEGLQQELAKLKALVK
jgi:uncharacterized coiled-coil DUF342 family protein